MLTPTKHPVAGFTLIETVVATGILITVLAGVAQLLALCVRSTREAGAQGVALRAAQSKLETLRAAALTYDRDGAPITHHDLEPSPPDTLYGDRDGYVDWLDEHGVAVGADRDGAWFIRRWAVSRLDAGEPEAVAIEVCVFAFPSEGAGPPAADACLSTIRSRQP